MFLVFVVSPLCEFCYFLTICVSMVSVSVIKIVRGLHSQTIAQTGYGGSESGESCVYILLNKSCDFIFKKNELICDCFCILFVRRDSLCRCRAIKKKLPLTNRV